MKTLRVVVGILIVLTVCYIVWYSMDRGELDLLTKEAFPIAFDEYGINHDNGNVVGVQPSVTPRDYPSKQRFMGAMERYLSAAKQKGWLNSKTVVLYPEYIGTWLVVANEKNSVYTASTTTQAIKQVVFSHLFSFLKARFGAKRFAVDITKYSVFKIKAHNSARIYHEVFSELARKYQVTLVAGSILLPNPQIKNGQLKVSDGPLYNVTVVYKPDGKPYDDIVYKTYLTTSESSFTRAGKVDKLPVFDTPAGKVGVLICADAWYPPAYEVLQRQQVSVILVPSFKTLSTR